MPEPIAPMISPSNVASQPSSKSRRSRSQARQMSSARYSTSAARARARGRPLAQVREVVGRLDVEDAELAEERPVDDEVRVAADRGREMAVRAAREARVAEVARVVARLLERAEDEGRERLLPAPGRARRSASPLARPGREPRGLRRREVLRARAASAPRGRRASRGAARPTAGRAARGRGRARRGGAREQLGDRLVRGDHQLLDEHVRERLALDPGPLDAALAVEGERDLPPRRGARRARSAGRGARPRPLGEPQRLARARRPRARRPRGRPARGRRSGARGCG